MTTLVRTWSDSNALAALVARHGIRFTTRDVAALGIPGRCVEASVAYGLAVVEGVREDPTGGPPLTFYLVTL